MNPSHHSVRIRDAIAVSNQGPFVLFGGLNVLESKDLALRTAKEFVRIAGALEPWARP